jgi:hypothetical protein
MLATFLTFAHHQPDCPYGIKAITQEHEGVPWTAKLAGDIRGSVTAAFKQILKETTSTQVS